MVKAYNFLASWQLFPEKGQYQRGERPKSGLYKIETDEEQKALVISHSWTSLENQGYAAQYRVLANGKRQPFDDAAFADEVQVNFIDSGSFELHFYKAGQVLLHLLHQIEPNGWLKITQQGKDSTGEFCNTEYYHKQMSVLPYAASVSGAVIKPTAEGVIRHKALAAMEEQTNMQLDQIRKQVELLALQAQEIQQRKELALLIYNAKLSFKPEIGQVYYLYQKKDDAHLLSLISPREWGTTMPYKKFVAAVRMLSDHTWKEVQA